MVCEATATTGDGKPSLSVTACKWQGKDRVGAFLFAKLSCGKWTGLAASCMILCACELMNGWIRDPWHEQGEFLSHQTITKCKLHYLIGWDSIVHIHLTTVENCHLPGCILGNSANSATNLSKCSLLENVSKHGFLVRFLLCLYDSLNLLRIKCVLLRNTKRLDLHLIFQRIQSIRINIA